MCRLQRQYLKRLQFLGLIVLCMNIYIARAAKSSIKAAKILDEWRSWRGCIDSHTAKYLTQYKESANQEVQVITASINLGISNEPLKLTENGLVLPHTDSTKESLLVTWEEIEMIGNKKQGCYALYDDDSKPWHISALSGNTGMTHKCLTMKTNYESEHIGWYYVYYADIVSCVGIPASLCAPLESTGAPTMVLGM